MRRTGGSPRLASIDTDPLSILAVALLFHGHNNEAGDAARIEKFKQFMRFRLTEHDLTGFVIAVDEPKQSGSQLKPRLIDVIYLTPK